MHQQRSIATVILLTFVTCGIYLIYLAYVTMQDINNYLEIVDMNTGLELLLFMCTPYSLYWYYKYAQRTSDVNIKAGLAAKDDAVVCLILAVFGFGIISMALIQNNLNQAWAAQQSEGY